MTSEAGSQTLEFALVLPAVVFVLVLVVHAGLLGMDMVAAQAMVREAARAAAVDGDAAAHDALDQAAGKRGVELSLTPVQAARDRGDQVTAGLRLRSNAFAAFGADLWIPARAIMRVEHP